MQALSLSGGCRALTRAGAARSRARRRVGVVAVGAGGGAVDGGQGRPEAGDGGEVTEASADEHLGHAALVRGLVVAEAVGVGGVGVGAQREPLAAQRRARFARLKGEVGRAPVVEAVEDVRREPRNSRLCALWPANDRE